MVERRSYPERLGLHWWPVGQMPVVVAMSPVALPMLWVARVMAERIALRPGKQRGKPAPAKAGQPPKLESDAPQP